MDQLPSTKSIYSNVTPNGRSWLALNSWIFAQMSTVIFLILLIFCIYKLYKYGRRKGKWQLKWSDRRKILMTLAIVTPIMTVGRVVLTQAVIIIGLVAPVGEVGDLACKVYYSLSIVFYYLSGKLAFIRIKRLKC